MMFTKRSAIAALAGLNLFLLACLLFHSYSLPAAYAQRAGAASGMVAVTARADTDYDVMYLLDLGQRRLHCFVPNRDRSGAFAYGGSRDLAVDFQR